MDEIKFSGDREQKRRYKTLAITPEVLQAICTTGWRRDMECVKGLPDNARFVYAYVDHRQVICLVFEHESFEEVSIHTLFPDIEASFKTYYDNHD